MASKKGRKSEKQNKTPEVVQIEERPAEREIVPGKEFYENDWTQLLQKEEDLSFISSLVEEVFEQSCVIVVHQANEKEAYKFSIQWAKQLMIDKVKCFFLECDHGGGTQASAKDDPNSIEDLEPDAPIIDSWARGVVPMIEEDQELKEEENSKEEERRQLGQEKPDEEQAQSIISDDILNTISPINPSVKPKTTRHKTRNDINKSMKVLISPPDNMEESNEESPSLLSHTPFSSTAFISIPSLMTGPNANLKLSHKRSQLMTDQHNRIIQTIRLDTRKFPSPSTRPIVTLEETKPSLGHSRNTALKKDTSLKSSVRRKPPPKYAPISKSCSDKTTDSLGGINRIASHRVPKEPTLPPFLDIIDPLPGVTVYENGQSLAGHTSPRTKPWSPRVRLQPITPIGKKTLQNSESRCSNIKQSDSLKLMIPSPLDNINTHTTVNIS